MSEPNIRDELAKATTAEPLLPIELTLIRWSLGIGIVLLVILVAVTYYFPATA